MDGIEYLRVKNGLSTKIRGRFNGVWYDWKPGESLDMPIKAAEHLFGFGLDDKISAFHRLGWVNSRDTIEDAQKKLEMMSFDPIQQVFQMSGKGGKKLRLSRTAQAMLDAQGTGNDRSLVNAGGTEGGELIPPDDQSTGNDEGENAEAI
jgi:hypothetical protein